MEQMQNPDRINEVAEAEEYDDGQLHVVTDN